MYDVSDLLYLGEPYMLFVDDGTTTFTTQSKQQKGLSRFLLSNKQARRGLVCGNRLLARKERNGVLGLETEMVTSQKGLVELNTKTTKKTSN